MQLQEEPPKPGADSRRPAVVASCYSWSSGTPPRTRLKKVPQMGARLGAVEGTVDTHTALMMSPQQLLAHLAVLWLENPSTSKQRQTPE